MSLGISIKHSSKPLLCFTYEVTLVHPSSIRLQQKFESLQESNPGPLGLEPSVQTTRTGLIPKFINIIDLYFLTFCNQNKISTFRTFISYKCENMLQKLKIYMMCFA